MADPGLVVVTPGKGGEEVEGFLIGFFAEDLRLVLFVLAFVDDGVVGVVEDGVDEGGVVFLGEVDSEGDVGAGDWFAVGELFEVADVVEVGHE